MTPRDEEEPLGHWANKGGAPADDKTALGCAIATGVIFVLAMWGIAWGTWYLGHRG